MRKLWCDDPNLDCPVSDFVLLTDLPLTFQQIYRLHLLPDVYLAEYLKLKYYMITV